MGEYRLADCTPGPVEVRRDRICLTVYKPPARKGEVVQCGYEICTMHGWFDPTANAQLIAEAFNVAGETGLTPRELMEQRLEMVRRAKNLLEQIDFVASRLLMICHNEGAYFDNLRRLCNDVILAGLPKP